MSSHYYVKEGQEPALIIANGEMCSSKLLHSLLEWSPFIVVLDGAYERVLNLKIKPDVVIGDFDSISDITYELDIEYVKIDEQETTDFEKGIEYLIKKGYQDINVVWATGKRLDHTINNFAILAKYKATGIVLYDDHSKAFALPNEYSKFYPKNTKLSLFPIGRVSGITTSNLSYNLSQETLTLGERSGSNNSTEKEGVTSIDHSEGVLILVESRD
jgi:thiamine pyrophosphokinase